MKLEQSFEVSAPLDRVWQALIDVQRVAPCLPGASVTGRNEDGSYNGEFKVKIGPTSAAYSGRLLMEDIDEGAHRATMNAAGTDKRGQGGAKATIVSTVTPGGAGETKVEVATDYHITGRLARFGRGGMIEEISGRLLTEFSRNLQAMLAGGGEETAPAVGAAPAVDTAPAVGAAPAVAGAAAAAGVPAPDAASADPALPAATPEPAVDPDAAIAGATPVSPEPEPAPTSTGTPPPSDAPDSEPISAVSLVGSVVLKRARENPAPLAALLIGFLLALRVLRGRG